MTTGFNTILCRYCEIALKGKNRGMFEQCLVDNIKYLLKKINEIKIIRTRGRMRIEHKDGNSFTNIELDEIKKQLPKAFGLASFSPGVVCKSNINEIFEAVEQCSAPVFNAALDKFKNPSFRIRARRSFKEFPLRSKEIEIQIAELVDKLHNSENRLRVDLENPDVSVGCEVRNNSSFIFFEIFKGPGGLPTGSNAPLLCLISGGIDSSVAAAMMMKRGCRVNFLTFDSFPYTPPEAVEKVKRLTEVLNTFQKPGKLFICNLAEIQKQIRDNCTEKFRTILYRRYMFRIAEHIAKLNNDEALLTGEAVGQVASQTIKNLSTINNATQMLILRPLAGMDKEEIIKIARQLNTFEISKEQVPDSCTVFAPNAPSTGAELERIEAEEERLKIDELIEKTITDTWASVSIN
jgi:thiamine biosynthesis protein ThiI